MTATDLYRLIPPGINTDPQVIAAARAAGGEEFAVRGLVPLIHIWSRLETAPEALLDHLAWHLHIDGYQYAATAAEKRWLVMHFHDWHRFKGTEHGHRLYWQVLLKRDLLHVAPLHKSYLSRSLTEDERTAFESVHPEIRIYPFRHAGVQRSFFVGDLLGGEGHTVHPAQTDAILRIGSRVTLYDPADGTETDLHSLRTSRTAIRRTARETVTLKLPGQGAGLFFGRPLAGYINRQLADDPDLAAWYDRGDPPDPETERINPDTGDREPIPEIDLRRPEKLDDIRAAQKAAQAAGFTCANGITLDCRGEDLSRWTQAAVLLDTTGAPGITVRDKHNQNHDVTADAYRAMMAELGAHVQKNILGKYWALKDAVRSAATVAELDAIGIE